jgi:hypothetical protein
MGVSTIKHIHPEFPGQREKRYTRDALWAAEQCRVALAHLERAVTAPPVQRSREASATVSALIAVQEALADWERRETIDALALRWRTIDERIETVLALIVAMQAPFSNTERKTLVQAKNILHQILVEGLL